MNETQIEITLSYEGNILSKIWKKLAKRINIKLFTLIALPLWIESLKAFANSTEILSANYT